MDLQRDDTGARLGIAGRLGKTYVLSYTANLTPQTDWTPLLGHTMRNTNFWSYLDPQAATEPRRFYRVELLP